MKRTNIGEGEEGEESWLMWLKCISFNFVFLCTLHYESSDTVISPSAALWLAVKSSRNTFKATWEHLFLMLTAKWI